jgi:hypothetical protein
VDQVSFDIQRMLSLRKLTRAVADALRDKARDHVATVAPLLRPGVALVDPADAGTKDPFQPLEKNFKELQGLYEAAAGEPFKLHKDLRPPVSIAAAAIELTPLEYAYNATPKAGGGGGKVLRITSPLKWVISYAGALPGRVGQVSYTPRRLKELLAGGTRPVDELRQFILQYAALNMTLSRQAGVRRLLEALHFRITTERLPEFGQLPLPCLGFEAKTMRPPDDVLIEHTEIAGTDTFEEVVDVAELAALRDPVRDTLLDLAKSHGVAVP